MSPEVTETRLPGIGVRYGFTTRDGDRISVILRTDGDSELYVFGKFDGDKPRAVVDLTESEARQLREPDPVVGAQPGDVIKTGDTLVTAGTRANYGEFRRVLAEGPIPES